LNLYACDDVLLLVCVRQQYGAQPPLEMLRLLLDRAGLFDR
jgi:hypothetical protein